MANDDGDALRDLLRREVLAARERDETAVLEAALARVEALQSLLADGDSERAKTLERVAELACMRLDPDWVSPPSARLLVLGALERFLRASEGESRTGPDATALTELVADALRLELEGCAELRAYRERQESSSPDRALTERRLQARRKRIRARIQRDLARDPDPQLRFRHWRSPL